jgi:hypothetical protein
VDFGKFESELNAIRQYTESVYVQEYRNYSYLEEIHYADVFNSTITGSSWWKYPINPGGSMAVGYSFLYALYRILDEIRPDSILELGLGQSTLMTTAYACDKKDKVRHVIVEHDKEWIEFFKPKLHGYNYEIFTPNLGTVDVEGHKINIYDDISPVMKDKKYNLMILDAPFGSKFISRIDTLDYIPESLEDDFIIMLHDAQREGEQNTIKMLENLLDEGGVEFAKGYYGGRADTYVAASGSLKFVTTL